MKPCVVSAITSGGRTRTTRAASRRITSIRRGSLVVAGDLRSPRRTARSSASRTTRPSAFETIFCARTTTSPSSSSILAAISSARSSSAAISGRSATGMMRSSPVRETREPDAGVRLVALVHVQDHRSHALERPRVLERADVDGASGHDVPGELERELLGAGVVAADRARRPGRLSTRVRRRERLQSRRDRGRARSAHALPRASPGVGPGERPRRVKRRSLATQSSGVVADRVCQLARRSRASHSDLTASTTRSAPATTSAFAAARDAELGARSPGARSASREPTSTSSLPISCESLARARARRRPVPPTIATLHANATASSARFGEPSARAPRSCINVRVTTGRTPELRNGSASAASSSSSTSASIRPG